jgi:hypothetical protein
MRNSSEDPQKLMRDYSQSRIYKGGNDNLSSSSIIDGTMREIFRMDQSMNHLPPYIQLGETNSSIPKAPASPASR